MHPSIGDNPGPANEAQVRPLIGLEPEKAKAAWEKAAEKAEEAMITVKLVKEAVAETMEVLLDKALKCKATNTKNTTKYDSESVQLALDTGGSG